MLKHKSTRLLLATSVILFLSGVCLVVGTVYSLVAGMLSSSETSIAPIASRTMPTTLSTQAEIGTPTPTATVTASREQIAHMTTVAQTQEAATMYAGTPLPTWDPSTPVPPSGEWATYVYPDSGLSFSYPANWFTSLDEESNRLSILNAPPGGEVAIKHSGNATTKFVRITVYLKPSDIPPSQTLETFVNDTIQQWSTVSVELIPALRQGYPAVRVASSGMGQRISLDYFVANDRHVVRVADDYVSDRPAELASVVEEVINTLTFP